MPSKRELLLAKRDLLVKKRALLEEQSQEIDEGSSFLEGAIEGLPLAGATAGGLLGGALGAPAFGAGAVPGAIGGATAGGFIGQNLRDAIQSLRGREPVRSIPETAQRALQTGLEAGASEGLLPGAASLARGGKAAASKFAPAVRELPVIKPTLDRLQSTAQGVARRLGTSALPQGRKEVVEAVVEGAPTLGEEVATRGFAGTKKKLFNLAKSNVRNVGNQIDDALEAVADSKIDPNEVVKSLAPVKARFRGVGNNAAIKQIEKWESEWLGNMIQESNPIIVGLDNVQEFTKKGFLSPKQANLLKRFFGQDAKAVFKQQSPDAVSAVRAEFSNALRSGLKKEVENVAPGIKELNKDFRFFDDFFDEMAGQIGADLRSKGLTLANPFSTGGAITAGAFTGGAAGAAAAGTAVQLGRAFPVKTYLAALAAKFGGRTSDPKVLAQASQAFLAHPKLMDLALQQAVKAQAFQKLRENRRNK